MRFQDVQSLKKYIFHEPFMRNIMETRKKKEEDKIVGLTQERDDELSTQEANCGAELRATIPEGEKILEVCLQEKYWRPM